MKVQRLVLPICATNCYIAINEQLNEALIIDPGSAGERIIEAVKACGATPKAILLTHGHFDHAGDADMVAKEFGLSIYAYEDEKAVLEDPHFNQSDDMLGQPANYTADIYLKDRQELDLAGLHIIVLHTPGHTPGGCCYYIPYEKVMFTGDTLFAGSVGRTDFPGGSMSDLIRGIKDKIMTLPTDINLLPGHEGPTTIEEERMYNPYL